MTERPRHAPDLADIDAMARDAFERIPERLRRHATDVVIRVEEFPDAETVAEMNLQSPFDLLGLYRGLALTERSLADPQPDIDMVFLYRRPLLDYWCETGEDLVHLVGHVLVHEIGHHFGFSDADMEAIEADMKESSGG